jgi:hypothetical protein
LLPITSIAAPQFRHGDRVGIVDGYKFTDENLFYGCDDKKVEYTVVKMRTEKNGGITYTLRAYGNMYCEFPIKEKYLKLYDKKTEEQDGKN